MPFHEIPFFRLFICIIAGIGISSFLPVHNFQWFYLFSLFCICLHSVVSSKLSISTWLFHLTFTSLVWAILFSRMEDLNPLNKKSFFGNDKTLVKYQGRVLSLKSRIKGGWRYVLEVSHVYDNEDKGRKANGLLLLYLSESKLKPFVPGAIIQGEIKTLLPLPVAFNPGSFNQQKYWKEKRIFYKAYGDRGHWRITHRASGSLFLRDYTQNFISGIFGKAIKDTISLGLINALLLGNKSGLSPEIMTDFKRTGAVHILAVSGLHVGILVGIIQFILGLFPVYTKSGQIFSSLIFILFLLLFAWLTHFEPAIVRAVGGSILIISSKIFQKTANAWNNLFAMACFLLLLEPNNIYHIGFQLSFVAVAGILAFYKSWVKRIHIKNKLLAYFWEMSVMGFAAQWVTLPLLLFHFQQFSWLFLITGWIAIPLSTFILAFSLLYLIISFIPILNILAGWVLESSIYLFRSIMSWLSNISWAVSEGIYLHLIASVFLSILVLSLAYAIECRKRNMLIFSLCLLLSLFHYSFIQRNQMEEEVYILSERENAVFTVRKGRSFYVFSKKPVEKQRQDLLFLGQWATHFEYLVLGGQLGSFHFKTKTLVVMDGDYSKDFIPFGTHWWVIEPVYGNWQQWMLECPPKTLILNGNLPFRFKKYLVEIAEKSDIEVVDIYKSGAYFFKNEYFKDEKK
ncbi:MAG: hypothetical protein RLZZ417_1372 [Bacteroidota bacterium]|jgi:competence protein ComEC